jgi:hypothetical protein
MKIALLSLPLLVACNKGDDDSSAPADDSAAAEGPTYYKEVRPILDQTCARCHTDGGVAPVSFDDPETVQALAMKIQIYTREGIMPPPAPDPTCAPYEGAETYFLTDDAKQTLSDWADAGAPLGDPVDAPPPHVVPTLAPFDAELRGEAAWTPEYQAGEKNAYRCWAFDLGNEADVFVTGFEALIDQLAEVHHAALFLDWSYTADVDDADGFDCSGLGEEDWQYIHAWGPGAPYLEFAEGQGLRFPAHARVVYQSHYFLNGTPTPDNSGYGLLLADSVDTEIFVLPLGVTDFVIPAGESDAQQVMDMPWPAYKGDFTLLGVWPHMHQLGSGFDFGVTHADESESCVVDMNGYDFHNQLLVWLDTPVSIAPGDDVRLVCHYDNSEGNANNPNSPPVDVDFGEGSDDEMCFGFAYGHSSY